jgi:hypothetical protein
VVALTLPDDVLVALRSVHHDPGWAIVRLVESTVREPGLTAAPRTARPLAELVYLPGGRALIVVEPQPFKRLRGVATIPLADGRAFLAFENAGGLADLELALVDALEKTPTASRSRAPLAEIRGIVRGWRRHPKLAFRTRSIIVVEGIVEGPWRPLAPLKRDAPTPRASSRRRRPRRRS